LLSSISIPEISAKAHHQVPCEHHSMGATIANGRLDWSRPKTDRQKSSKTDKFTCLLPNEENITSTDLKGSSPLIRVQNVDSITRTCINPRGSIDFATSSLCFLVLPFSCSVFSVRPDDFNIDRLSNACWKSSERTSGEHCPFWMAISFLSPVWKHQKGSCQRLEISELCVVEKLWRGLVPRWENTSITLPFRS
jgi:hypothetical protein